MCCKNTLFTKLGCNMPSSSILDQFWGYFGSKNCPKRTPRELKKVVEKHVVFFISFCRFLKFFNIFWRKTETEKFHEERSITFDYSFICPPTAQKQNNEDVGIQTICFVFYFGCGAAKSHASHSSSEQVSVLKSTIILKRV